MWANPTAEVGAFFLERTYRAGPLRVYNVSISSRDRQTRAILWCVNKPEVGVEEEWRIKCLYCPPAPSLVRKHSTVEVFTTRERALAWLLRHRSAAHPPYLEGKMRNTARIAMERNDPDGKDKEPTEQDYKEFEEWAVKTFGIAAYQEYMKGGWGEVREV